MPSKYDPNDEFAFGFLESELADTQRAATRLAQVLQDIYNEVGNLPELESRFNKVYPDVAEFARYSGNPDRNYHDVVVQIGDAEPKEFSKLPFTGHLHCNRVGGWELSQSTQIIAGEFHETKLKIWVGGILICGKGDNRPSKRKLLVESAVRWNDASNPVNSYECKDSDHVRGTSYSEVFDTIGTSGCSKEYPYYIWSVLGVIETPRGKLVVSPGDWIVTFSSGRIEAYSDSEYRETFL